jgi:hypothetical protein
MKSAKLERMLLNSFATSIVIPGTERRNPCRETGIPTARKTRYAISVEPFRRRTPRTLPVHAGETPSFSVNPSKQVFHCHGSGVGSEIFQFLRLRLQCGS